MKLFRSCPTSQLLLEQLRITVGVQTLVREIERNDKNIYNDRYFSDNPSCAMFKYSFTIERSAPVKIKK